MSLGREEYLAAVALVLMPAAFFRPSRVRLRWFFTGLGLAAAAVLSAMMG